MDRAIPRNSPSDSSGEIPVRVPVELVMCFVDLKMKLASLMGTVLVGEIHPIARPMEQYFIKLAYSAISLKLRTKVD